MLVSSSLEKPWDIVTHQGEPAHVPGAEPTGSVPPLAFRSMGLLTVGHGTLPAAALVALLTGAGVAAIADVRRYPASRRHPHFAADALEATLAGAGIRYRWEPDLGGRRSPAADSPHTALRNAAFRGYADHMDSPAFAEALDRVLAAAAGGTTAVLCAESVWWRCHRRLIADAVVLGRGLGVDHLMHDGSLRPHAPTDGARAAGGRVVYDADEPGLTGTS